MILRSSTSSKTIGVRSFFWARVSSAYLYKDVLELGGIRNPRKLRDLLRLLAYQVGAELDYVEEGDGRLAGFEFKLRERGLAPPASWLAAYPEASFATVTPGTTWNSRLRSRPSRRDGDISREEYSSSRREAARPIDEAIPVPRLIVDSREEQAGAGDRLEFIDEDRPFLPGE